MAPSHGPASAVAEIMIASLAALALVSLPETRAAGWLVFWNPKSITTFLEKTPKIREVMIEWAGVDEEGQPFARSIGSVTDKAKVFAAARKSHVRTFMMASNFAESSGFDAKRLTRMLSSDEKRKSHAEKLVELAKSAGFEGIDLDYESLEASDREAFTRFVKHVKECCKSQKLLLSVTVHPKTSEPGTWNGPQAQDWKALGSAADIFRIMAYDQSWSTSPMGPIAANSWVKDVLTFAVSQVPAKKIELGIACYGYDWSTQPARSLTWDDLPKNPAFTLRKDSQERTWDKIVFSGAEAVASKTELAKKYRIRGLSFWYIGSEDPAFWNLIP